MRTLYQPDPTRGKVRGSSKRMGPDLFQGFAVQGHCQKSQQMYGDFDNVMIPWIAPHPPNYYYNIVYYEKHNIWRTSISRVNKPDPQDAATASAPPTAAPTATIATAMPLLLLLVEVLLWCGVVCCGGVYCFCGVLWWGILLVWW